MSRKKAFTLLEIAIVLVVLGILIGISFSFYKNAIKKAQSTEAIITAGQIRQAEEFHKIDRGKYVAAESTEEINEELGLEINSKYYEYRIVDVTEDNFIVIARRIDEEIESGKSSSPSIVIAMDKSGIISGGYRGPIGPGGTSGGSGGGFGGGGIGGGGSGTGGFGTGTGGGGGGGVTGGSGGGTGGGTGGGSGISTAGSGVTVAAHTGGGWSGGAKAGGSGATVDSGLQSAIELLRTSTSASYAYDLIQENKITVKFDDFSKYPDVSSSTLAFWWGIANNTIYVNQTLKDRSSSALAAIIAHEATHADYSYYSSLWEEVTLRRHPELKQEDLHISVSPYDSIDQEYNAFVNGMLTWKELKGSTTDIDNDGWEKIYNQGEDYMRSRIKSNSGYKDLPNY